MTKFIKCDKCRGTGIRTDHKAIGAEMKSLRLAAGISLRLMARKLHISHGFLCQLESGRRRWTPVMERCYQTEVKALVAKTS